MAGGGRIPVYKRWVPVNDDLVKVTCTWWAMRRGRSKCRLWRIVTGFRAPRLCGVYLGAGRAANYLRCGGN